eukprot:14013205-Alexandrium_andersonii.AAC.1
MGFRSPRPLEVDDLVHLRRSRGLQLPRFATKSSHRGLHEGGEVVAREALPRHVHRNQDERDLLDFAEELRRAWGW